MQYRDRNVTIHAGNASYFSFEVQSQACNTQVCPPGENFRFKEYQIEDTRAGHKNFSPGFLEG